MSLPESSTGCYRHPDRPAYVRCQRCERRVCPDCQIPAAVGVICPECMRQERGSTPPAVRRARGGAESVATLSIIGVTVAVYVLQFVPGLGITNAFLYAGIYSAPGYFEPWRLLTTVFVHSTGFILHLVLNMYTLWIFGRLLEGMIGSRRFLALYLLAGLGGSIGVLWLAGPTTPVVGASGAIFGVIGAFVVIHRSLGGSAPQLYVLLALNLLIGFLPGTGIAWQAHVGGLATGALIGWIFSITRRPNQRRAQIGALLGVLLLLLALSLRYVLMPLA